MSSAFEADSAMVRLAAAHLKAPASEVAITRVTGDASTRAYFRAVAADTSVIIAQYSAPFDETTLAADRLISAEASNPAARLTFANDPCAHIEVTELFLEAGLPVPRIFGASGADSLLLIEDVGDIRLQDWLNDRSEQEAVDAYRIALELAIRIQEATEAGLRTNCICSCLAFDEGKLRWELGFFFANYFNKHLKAKLDPATANAVQQDFKQLCADLSGRPRVLTHRDYHARNLMMHAGRMFIIDHQDARMGPASYDVASLLSDPYSTLSRETARELVEEFIEMKSRSSRPLPDIPAFREELELMTVQRMLKAIGTYASQAAAGNAVYVPYIEPALDRAIGAMNKIARFEATRRLLEDTRA